MDPRLTDTELTDALTVTILDTPSAHFRDSEIPGWEGNLRVVRWPGEDLVPGTFRGESDSGMFRFRFQPDAALDDGWYAVQIDLDALPVRRTLTGPELDVRDGWTTSRFRVGTYPIIRVLGVFQSPSVESAVDSQLLFVSSELVPFSGTVRLADYLDVVVNGEPVRCGVEGLDSPPTSLLDQFVVNCPRVPEGARITMRFRDGLFADGVVVRTIRGESPPSWTFMEGASPEGDGVVSDDLFVAPESP